MPNVNNYYSISANDQNGYLSSLESLLRNKAKLDEKTLSRVVNDVRSTLSSMDADRSSSGLQLDIGDSVAKHFSSINSIVLGSIGDKVAKQSVSEGLSSLVQTLQSKAPIISVPVGNPQPAAPIVVQPGPMPASTYPTQPSSGAPKPRAVVTPPVIPSQTAKDIAAIQTPKPPAVVTPPVIPSQMEKDLANIKATTPQVPTPATNAADIANYQKFLEQEKARQAALVAEQAKAQRAKATVSQLPAIPSQAAKDLAKIVAATPSSPKKP